jgi:hypothetical protein
MLSVGAHHCWMTRLTTGVAIVGSAAALAACGSSQASSSKPAYCTQVSDFQSAAKDLKSTDVGQGQLSANAQKVQSTGQAAVSAVKGAYAPQTDAVKSSLGALGQSVKQLGDASTRRAAAQQVPTNVAAVKTAANNLSEATKSKCR